MDAGILIGIFWATVYLGHKIEDMRQEQLKIYKDLALGLGFLVNKAKEKNESVTRK